MSETTTTPAPAPAPAPANTNPLAPGRETSEWSLAKLGVYVGGALEVVALILAKLQESGLGAPWLPVAAMVVGGLLQAASVFGYQRSRGEVKAAAIAAGTPLVTTPAQARAVLEGRPP